MKRLSEGNVRVSYISPQLISVWSPLSRSLRGLPSERLPCSVLGVSWRKGLPLHRIVVVLSQRPSSGCREASAKTFTGSQKNQKIACRLVVCWQICFDEEVFFFFVADCQS